MLTLFLLVLISSTAAIFAQESARGRPAQAPKVTHPRFYSKVHALCIGIDRYRSVGIPELNWSEQDAAEVSTLFADHYGYTVTTLIGQQATKRAIVEALEDHLRELGPDEALIIFFAGHGQTVEQENFSRTGFLLPVDAQLDLDDTRDPQEWETEAISMSRIGELVKQTEARHVLFLADACFSGFIGRRSGLDGRIDYQRLILHPSRMVITSGTEDQTALESDRLKHGYFTYALLEQLRRDRALAATELFVSLRRHVAKLSDGQMLPQLREVVVDNGEFVFLPKVVADEAVADAIQEAEQAAWKRGARTTKLEDITQAFLALDYRYASEPARLEKAWQARFKRFQDNAALGDPLAMAGLHYCYSKGLGTEKNPIEAYAWARRSFDSGHPAGIHVLARSYLIGLGVAENEVAAFNLFNQAASVGFPISQLTMAHKLFLQSQQNTLTDEERETMLRLFQESADAGIAQSNFWLGQIAGGGFFGVPRDPQKAVELLLLASDGGFAEADLWLSMIYSNRVNGATYEVNIEEARKRLLKSAEAGHAGAQADLGKNYLRKDFAATLGLHVDYAQGRRWLELAAKQGSIDAHYELAKIFADGIGVAPDPHKAKTLIETAVRGNHVRAMVTLGMWLHEGKIIEKDYQQAKRLFRRAAEMGDLDACHNYAAIIAEDDPEISDFSEMMYWYVKAASNGYEASLDPLREFANGLRSERRYAEIGVPTQSTYRDAFRTFKKDHPASAEKFVELVGLNLDEDQEPKGVDAHTKQDQQPDRGRQETHLVGVDDSSFQTALKQYRDEDFAEAIRILEQMQDLEKPLYKADDGDRSVGLARRYLAAMALMRLKQNDEADQAMKEAEGYLKKWRNLHERDVRNLDFYDGLGMPPPPLHRELEHLVELKLSDGLTKLIDEAESLFAQAAEQEDDQQSEEVPIDPIQSVLNQYLAGKYTDVLTELDRIESMKDQGLDQIDRDEKQLKEEIDEMEKQRDQLFGSERFKIETKMERASFGYQVLDMKRQTASYERSFHVYRERMLGVTPRSKILRAMALRKLGRHEAADKAWGEAREYLKDWKQSHESEILEGFPSNRRFIRDTGPPNVGLPKLGMSKEEVAFAEEHAYDLVMDLYRDCKDLFTDG